MATLSKAGAASPSGGPLYTTSDYGLFLGEENVGYQILNRVTGAVEMFADNLSSGVLALLWLQDQYDKIMPDPEAYWKSAKGNLNIRPPSPLN